MSMVDTPPRNGELELLRFLAALMIVGYHACIFKGGYLGVDLFFMLSGVLLALSLRRYPEQTVIGHEQLNRETWGFLKRKLKAFLPELAVSAALFAVCYTVVLWQAGESPTVLVANLNNFIDDGVLLLRMTGLFPPHDYNDVTWYLSAMLLASCLLFPLFRRCGHAPYLLAGGLILFGSVLIQDDSSLDGWELWCGVTYKANIRAVGGMTVGFFLYPVAQWLRMHAQCASARLGCTVLKAACGGMLLFFALTQTPNEGSLLVVIAAWLAIAFAGAGADAPLYQNRLCLFLGRLSLPLYLCHLLFANPAFQTWLGQCGFSNAGAVAVVYLLSLVTALMIMPLCAQLRRRLGW